jgi:cyclohexadienyl dehydratase
MRQQGRWWRIVAAAVAVVLVGGLGLAAAHPQVSRLEKVTKAKRLRVCIWPEYYAISYKNPATGELEGIDIDLARDMGKELKAEVQFVETTFATFIADLQADKCDVAMFGLGATLSRAQAVEFSQPYLETSIFGVAMRANQKIKGWADIDKLGHVVAVQLGSYVETFMKGYLKQAKVLSVQPPATREQEVAAGRADILMTDYPIARKLTATHDWARIVAPPQPLAVTPYAYAVAPGDQVWLNWINLFVAWVKRDGRLLGFAKKHGLEAIVEK